jgi:hypothetical protein
MSPRNEVFQAIPFATSSDANEILIAAGDAEEEDRRLQVKVVSRFKFSSLLLGFLVGLFSLFCALGVNGLVFTIWGEDAASKAKTVIFISLLLGFFCLATSIVIVGFLGNRVASTYSAIGGPMALRIQNYYGMGALVGISLAWTMAAVYLGLRAETVYFLVTLLVALFSCKVLFHKYQAFILSPIEVEQSTV